MRTATTNDDQAPPVNTKPDGDEQIYCPVCNYNLTGIHSGRCPECGSLFDREVLRTTQRAHAVILMPWDDPNERSWLVRLRKTVPICLLQPGRFARAFGVQRQDTKAKRLFGLVLLALILIDVGALVVAATAGDTLFRGEWVTTGAFLGFYLIIATCISTLLAGVILALFCTHYDGKRHLRPWFAIAKYSSVHYLLTGLIVPLVPLAVVLRRTIDPPLFVVGVCIILHFGGGCLSGFTLNGVISHRTAKHRRTIIAPVALAVAFIRFIRYFRERRFGF